ncbi:Protein of unknown function [Bacillus cytotoxicus]|nr:Protein of unknown function [Bacillus cytotoxicus]
MGFIYTETVNITAPYILTLRMAGSQQTITYGSTNRRGRCHLVVLRRASVSR